MKAEELKVGDKFWIEVVVTDIDSHDGAWPIRIQSVDDPLALSESPFPPISNNDEGSWISPAVLERARYLGPKEGES